MGLKETIKQAEALRKEWDRLQPPANKDEERLWEKLRLEWNYNSNHIEGNTLTYLETKQLLLKEIVSRDHSTRELDEMRAHDAAVQMVTQWADDPGRDISETDIRELNRVILVKPYWKNAITEDGQDTKREIRIGEYKKHPNSVRLQSGEIFHYTSPEETPQEMEKLMEWYRNTGDEHPVILAAEMHYRFVRIHPFDDGNGRIARLLTNYILMRHSYLPIVIKNKEKDQYFTALQKADTGEIRAFHEFIAMQLVWSLELGVKAAKGESIEEPDDLDKKISVFHKEIKNEEVEVHRSNEAIKEVVKNNYIPLLNQLNEEIQKFKKLYAKINTLGFSINSKGNIDTSFPEYMPFEDIIQRQLSLVEGRKLSKDNISLHSNFFKTFFFLMDFKNKDQPFNAEISTHITFFEYHFEIECFVGEPLTSGVVMEALVDALEVLGLDKQSRRNPLKGLKNRIEGPYNKKFQEEEIKENVKNMLNTLFEWTQEKNKSLK